MFDFEKLEVYTTARILVKKVLYFVYSNPKIDRVLTDQLKRSITSILFNLAEGTGRMTNADKKHFYTIARSSTFESVAILQVIKDQNLIDEATYQSFYNESEKISKMLLGMIRSFNR